MNARAPIKRTPKDKPLTKAEFHEVLREFLTSGQLVIAPGEHATTAWLWVKTLGNRYYLHADSTRDSVSAYLARVDAEGDSIRWSAVKNARGRPNKVAFGDDQETIPGFYLYRDIKDRFE